jgi:hypothetical protein
MNQVKKKMYRNLCFILLVLGVSAPALAQSADLARIEYTYFPQKNSDNSFRRFRAMAAYPIELKKDGSYLVPGIELRKVHFKYDDPEIFDTSNLDNFKSITATLGYTFKFGEDWRFGAEGGVKIASNFSEGNIIQEDLIYTGAVYFIKNKEVEHLYEPWRLILGLQYSTTTGFPFPLPIVNYHRRWNEKWAYALGTPKSNIKYFFNDRSQLQAFVTLDGFFANVQKNFDATPANTGNDNIVDNISMTVVLSGLGYEYSFTDHLKFYVYGGHTIINDIRLRDRNNNDVYNINETNTFYGRGGLKFTIF